ncbi:hypothetical protein C7447_102337 [Tenacibaculum adriaticum]|uniref:Uncharacterized protein n=1 Tax=Tenacibaculum adriaticum TaxID=413713 RepID=A0A5S5DWK9_9FLAO|nr:tetratricopeptide repeat-containing sensor histidine kinase [Tenacibaculum adriaticum]TYP99019.1 hypothetical protein C7447_102337 [Tenacibaculum adriaticum]
MKKIKLSFLFFYLLIVSIYSKKINAQQTKDSLSYYYNLQVNSKKSTDLILALNFYNRNKNFNLKKKDTFDAIQNLRFIASIQNKLGFVHESEATSVSALELINNIKSNKKTIKAKIGIYNHLGIINKELKNYDRALEFYNKVLEIEKSPVNINIALNNKANLNRVQNNFEDALIDFTQVYSNSLKLKDTVQIARALDNMGLTKSKLNIPSAEKDMLSALKMRVKKNNSYENFVSHIHLSEHYKDQQQQKKALLHANKALMISKLINSKSLQVTALSAIVNLNNNPKILEYKRLTDSISLAKQLNENKFASMKYDFSEERRKAEEAKRMLVESQLGKEKQKQLKFVYLAIGLFTLLTSVFSYFILKSKHKKEKLQQVYNTETRISKKVHDEVANDVYHVMTKLQGNVNVKEEVLDDLEGIYTKTRDISKENSTINVDDDFDELLKDLLLSYKSDDVNVMTRNISKVNWKKVSKEKKTTIYRVLQELMTNMKKYSEASIVLLAFNQTNNNIAIEYSDNGIGCDIKKHNGLQNVENRIQSVNGKITFDSQINNGFKVKITV